MQVSAHLKEEKTSQFPADKAVLYCQCLKITIMLFFSAEMSAERSLSAITKNPIMLALSF